MLRDPPRPGGSFTTRKSIFTCGSPPPRGVPYDTEIDFGVVRNPPQGGPLRHGNRFLRVDPPSPTGGSLTTRKSILTCGPPPPGGSLTTRTSIWVPPQGGPLRHGNRSWCRKEPSPRGGPPWVSTTNLVFSLYHFNFHLVLVWYVLSIVALGDFVIVLLWYVLIKSRNSHSYIHVHIYIYM